MRVWIFGKRTAKEILRDPLSLVFGLGFPLVLLCLMTVIQKNIPVSLFEPEHLTPGITAFGLSFLCLFSATLVSKDRCSSLVTRLRATPMNCWDFFFGYLLPLLPIAVLQMAVTYAAAMVLGLQWTVGILIAVAAQLPLAIFFLSLGILCGCLFSERQVGGVCGALLTNLAAWLSGAWFDLSLVGGWFEKVARAMPFAAATDAGRMILREEPAGLARSVWIMVLYAAAALGAAAWATRKMIKQG